MKITIEIYQDIKQVREAYKNHYGLSQEKPSREDLKEFISQLIEGDLEAIMSSNPT